MSVLPCFNLCTVWDLKGGQAQQASTDWGDQHIGCSNVRHIAGLVLGTGCGLPKTLGKWVDLTWMVELTEAHELVRQAVAAGIPL